MANLTKRSETIPAHVQSIAQAKGLIAHDLKCEFTRQRSEGKGVFNSGRPYRIKYDLMMCKYCGNLPGVLTVWYCPKKIQVLEQSEQRQIEGDS